MTNEVDYKAAAEPPLGSRVMRQLSLKDRIKLAKEHAAREGQRGDALWPYQRFALSLGELLDAAERGA